MGQHKFKGKRPGKRSRSTTTILIVVIVVAAIAVINYLQGGNKSAIDAFPPERSKGSEQAAVKIVEFIDFQCNHCKHGAGIIKEYMTDHPEAIRLTMKYFPLGQLNSSMSAYYAQCAARQGKFWEMHDELLASQDTWRTQLRVKDYFDPMAQKLGLNMAALRQCIDDGGTHNLVASERQLGNSYGIKSTPTYFINGQMTVGVQELEKALKDFVEKGSTEGM